MQNYLHFYQKFHKYYINIYTGKNNYSKEFKIENQSRFKVLQKLVSLYLEMTAHQLEMRLESHKLPNHSARKLQLKISLIRHSNQ